MNKEFLDKLLGKTVEIKLFDGTIVKGELHKSGEEQFKNNMSLYIPKNRYFTINPQSCLFRVSHIRKLEVVSNE